MVMTEYLRGPYGQRRAAARKDTVGSYICYLLSQFLRVLRRECGVKRQEQ